ncbi:MAG: tol-pal system protein YbgF [Alphaproteobacteria bacterium]|nr:tol-pal system protein YbgF [Alphaproteobacteria bacterium]
MKVFPKTLHLKHLACKRRVRMTCLWGRASIALLISLIALAAAAPAYAQNESLAQELQRLQRELSDVQRFVYKGGGTPPAGATSTLQRNDVESTERLQRHVLEIQAQMRELTGHIERIQHDVRLVGNRLDKLVADVDIRLQTLEGTAPATGSPQVGSTLGATPLKAPQVTPTTVISSDGTSRPRPELSVGQRTLGTISEKDLAAVSKGRPVQSAVVSRPVIPARAETVAATPPPARAAPAPRGVTSSEASVARAVSADGLPEGTAQQQYSFAFGKLKQRNYDEAETALRAFVERHPDDPLSGNAMYWMGETYYVRKQYPEAARIFLDAYQRFPKGNKAADNLFKLAKSLVQIGEKSSACTTYAELVKTFPKANARILSGAQADIKQLGCG